MTKDKSEKIKKKQKETSMPKETKKVLSEEELNEIKRKFNEPSPNRDPNEAFVITGLRGHPSRAAAKRAEEAEEAKGDKQED